MKAQLEAIEKKAFEELTAAQDLKDLDAVRVKYLGKKGELTAILKQMGKLSAEERPVIGQLANQVRAQIEERLEETKANLEAHLLDQRLATETLDVTMPGKRSVLGKKHPITIVLDELKLAEVKTKEMKKVLDNLKVNNALVIIGDDSENVALSARNIAGVQTASVNTINVFDMLKYNTIIATKSSVASIEEVYA